MDAPVRAAAASATVDPMRRVWIGTYPVAGAGTPVGLGEGVWTAELGEEGLVGLRQVVRTPAPSFLARHPSGRWLYAVNESARGTVTAFEVDGDVLLERAVVPSGGADPCHLLVRGGTLLVANYSSGTLGVLDLDPDGALLGLRQVLGFTGQGPDAVRQEASHAHFVALLGEEVLVADLGADVLRRYRGERELEPCGTVPLPPATGPRHLAVAADGRHVYVVGELAASLHVLEAGPEGLAPRQVLSLAGDRAVEGHLGWYVPEGRLLASHVELSGDVLRAGVRVDDRLEAFRVRPDGTLEPLESTPLRGWPRHFATVDGVVLVAGQTSHEVEVLAPGRRSRATVPSPACVLPA